MMDYAQLNFEIAGCLRKAGCREIYLLAVKGFSYTLAVSGSKSASDYEALLLKHFPERQFEVLLMDETMDYEEKDEILAYGIPLYRGE